MLVLFLGQCCALALLKELFWVMLTQIHTEARRLQFWSLILKRRALAGAHADNVTIIDTHQAEKYIAGSDSAFALCMFASVRAQAFSPGCYRTLRCKNMCICCPGFFVGYCTSLCFRVSVNPSGITVPSKPCQLSQVNVVRSTAKTHTPNPFECWNTRGAECKNMQHLEPQVIRAQWRERAICSLNASVRLFF